MIFAETERMFLRQLDRNELPRLVELIGVWDIARWLSVLPFPYRLQHAEEFYAEIEPLYDEGEPQFHVMALKTDNLLIGGVGLHAPRNAAHQEGEIEIGYWLAKDFWGRGLMTEAAAAVRDLAFQRPGVRALGANTAPGNTASQKILGHIGLRNTGLVERDYTALRGDSHIFKWLLTREEYEKGLPI